MREQLEARSRREVALARLGELALVGAPSTELTAAAARLVAAEIRVEYVQVYDLLPVGDALRLVAGVGPLGVDEPGRLEPIAVNSPLTSAELGASQPLIVPVFFGVMRRASSPEMPWPPAAASSAFVVASTGQSKRILGVHSREPHIFSTNELVFLETVAIMLVHAMERAAMKANSARWSRTRQTQSYAETESYASSM